MSNSKAVVYLKLLRAPFFTASVVPILVGTALAYSAGFAASPVIFALALFSMIAFQAGANISNDYFDHLSRNDWLNENATPFSGGSRVIQQDLLSPGKVLKYAFIVFALGIIAGVAIVVMTKSFFVLTIGAIGLFGAYFYTANPLKLGYRTAGEIMIGLLFGLLPVYGAYYIQTQSFDFVPVLPGAIVAVLIFQIILANEFPDFQADAAAGKKTIVVSCGINKAAVIYKICLLIIVGLTAVYSFSIANKVAGGILLLVSVALSALCLKFAKPETLCKKGVFDLNRATVLLHLLVGLVLAAVCLLGQPV